MPSLDLSALAPAYRRGCLILLHYALYMVFLAVPDLLAIDTGLYAWGLIVMGEACVVYAGLRSGGRHA